MRAAQAQLLPRCELLQTPDRGTDPVVRPDVQHLNATAFVQFFQFHLAARLANLRSADEVRGSDQQRPIVLGPPDPFQLADHIIAPRKLAGHLDGERSLVELADRGLKRLATRLAPALNGEVLRRLAREQYRFLRRGVFGFVELVKVDLFHSPRLHSTGLRRLILLAELWGRLQPALLKPRTRPTPAVIFLLALFALQQHFFVFAALLRLQHGANLVLLPLADGLHLPIHLLSRFMDLGTRVVQDDVELQDLVVTQTQPLLPLGDHLLPKLFRILGLVGIQAAAYGTRVIQPLAKHSQHDAAGEYQPDVQRDGCFGQLHFRRSV